MDTPPPPPTHTHTHFTAVIKSLLPKKSMLSYLEESQSGKEEMCVAIG